MRRVVGAVALALDPLDDAIALAIDEPLQPDNDPLDDALRLAAGTELANRRVAGTVEATLWGRFMRAKRMQLPASIKTSAITEAN